jgi:hypothetical protein
VRQALKVLHRCGYVAASNVASPCGAREGRCCAALEQVWRQQRYLGAEHAFIWLPNARVGLWRRWCGTNEGGTRIIYGKNAKALVRFLRRAGEWGSEAQKR